MLNFEDNDIVTLNNYKGIGVVENTTTFSDTQVVTVKWLDGTRCTYTKDQLINLSIKLSHMNTTITE